MAELYGRTYGEEDLARYAGNMEQLAGVRRFTYTQGKADGVRAVALDNGVLAATLLESRALDMASLRYRGMPLHFLGKAGIVAGGLADPAAAPLRSVTGGMFYTCGLTNVGDAWDADDYFHGRVRFLPAEQVCTYAGWEGGDYVLRVEGTMRQSGVLGENLSLRRCIETTLGSHTVTVRDRVRNEGFAPVPLMLMYHLTAGFPLLEEGAEVLIPAAEPLPTAAAVADAPHDDGAGGGSFLHTVRTDGDGYAVCGLINAARGLGLQLRFPAAQLPHLLQWKSTGSGDYAMGLMPTNSHAAGRAAEEHGGTLDHLPPRQEREFILELTVLDGAAELVACRQAIQNCVNESGRTIC